MSSDTTNSIQSEGDNSYLCDKIKDIQSEAEKS